MTCSPSLAIKKVKDNGTYRRREWLT